MTYRFPFFQLLIFSIFLFQCRSVKTPDKPQSAIKSGDRDTLTERGSIRLCLSAQGNGMNAPATWGWLSEVLRYEAAENPNATFEINCYAGSSSSSATGALFARVMANFRLHGDDSGGAPTVAPSYRKLSSQQLLRISKAIAIAARGADMGFRHRNELLWGMTPFAARSEPQPNDNWWDGATAVSAETAYNLFAYRIEAAKLLDYENLQAVQDLPEFSSREIIKQLPSAEYNAASRHAKNGYNQSIAQMHEQYSQIDENAIASLKASGSLPNGLLSSTYAFVDAKDSPRHVSPPDYRELRIIVFGTETTIDQIIATSSYQNMLSGELGTVMQFLANQFYFAAIDNLHDYMRYSILEPEMLHEGFFTFAEMGVSKVFDPQRYGDDFTEGVPAPIALRSAQNHAYADLALSIAGGWTNQAVNGVLLALYADSTSQTGQETKLYTFGKKLGTAQFSKRVITAIFSPESSPDENLELFYQSASQSRILFQSLFSPQPEVGFDWDIGFEMFGFQLPAMVQGNQRSQDLFAKAVNETRIRLGIPYRLFEQRKFIP